MKIYSKIKGNNQCIIRLLGIKLFHKKQEGRWSKIKYLYGLLKIKKCPNVKKVYFCGLQIFSRKILDITEIADNIKNTVINELKSTIINETRMANAVSNLHSRVFPQFKNINTGKDVVIVGTGPSLNYYLPINNAVHIGLNKAFMCDHIHCDYLFAIDYNAVKQYISKLKKYNCIKFLGMHCNPNIRLIHPVTGNSIHIPENLVDALGGLRFYSDAHRKRINYDIEQFPLMDKGSVAFPAIHFALYTSPKRIYLVGCDTCLNGYFDKSKDNSSWNLLEMALNGYNELKHFAEIYYPDVEIISVNPVGLRGLFRDVYTESYVKAEAALFKDVSDIEYLQDIINEVNV